ncbi:EAL domain-containing protein [Niveibacterium microcysteis]|uniref:EAL domain-containing protein n=1 Tax=Niveibacterium microcysteis TaxID=2811415 RepID=A0ABX7M6U0_9RHOO|nr:EAL domain-containing protein [Niveibacterium microcysteis]QSI76399.1 EAL domain-containing protein [Niveibacterium microcysteis]
MVGEVCEPEGSEREIGGLALLRANAALASAYLIAGLLSLMLAVPPGYASPLFPPAGIALGVVLIFGCRLLPGVFFGALLVNLAHGYALSAALLPVPAGAVALAVTLQAWCGRGLVMRLVGGSLRLDEPLDVMRFLGAVILSCAVAASLALPALYGLGRLPLGELPFSWWNWWLGDSLGAISFAPLTLLVLARRGDSWHGRRLAVGLPIAVALVALVVLFLQFSAWERSRVDRALERDAAFMLRGLRDSLQSPVDALFSMRQFIENSDDVTREEFSRFVRPWLARDAAVLALGRAEIVAARDLPALVARQRASGLADFRIIVRDAAGVRRPAPPGEARQRLVITAVEPLGGNRDALGLDVFTVDASRKASTRALESDRAAATQPFRLAQQRRADERGIVVYLPHGRAGGDGKVGGEPGGVIFVAFSLDDLVQHLAASTPPGLLVCLSDTSDRAPLRIAGAAGCETLDDGAFVSRASFNVADRSWTLRVAAQHAYLAAQSGVLRWWAPLFGLVGSALLVAFVLTSAGRTRRVEELVERRTAELSAAQRRYVELVNSLNGVIWEAERGPRGMLFISERVVPLLGYPVADWLGPDFWLQRTHPDDREAVKARLSEAMQSNESAFELEFRVQAQDGRYLWLQNIVTRMPEREGYSLLRGVALDITARHAVSEQLAVSERRLRAITSSASAYLYEIDADGVIRFVNRTYEGVTEAEVLGTRLASWFPPAMQGRITASLQQVWRSATSYTLEYALSDPQGRSHDYLTELTPVFENGRVLAVVLSAADITGVKRVEAQLRASERRFSEMLANVKLAAVQLDLQGRVTFCNAFLLELLGYRSDELVGQDWFEHTVSVAQRDTVRKVFRALLAEGRGVDQFENEICCRDGSVRHIAWNNTLLRDADGAVIGVASIGEDVTARHQAEAERERAWALLQAAIAQSPAGIVIVDAPSMRLRIANPAAIHLRGMAPGEDEQSVSAFMQGWQVFNSDGSPCAMEHWPIARAVQGEEVTENAELIVRDAEGRDRWITANAAPVRAADGSVIAGIVVFNDVTLIKEQQQRLAHLAHYDALTRLPNRVLLADRLQMALQQAERSQAMLAVAYLDLDGFKAVNDHLGHEAGDVLLVDVAGRLRGVLRGGDTVARIGGDEFVLLLRDLDDFGECEQALRRVLAEVAAPYRLEGSVVEISASIGVTVYPADGADPDTLLRHADQAMYVAKQGGRNRYHLFDAELDRRAREERALISRIGAAIAAGELVLHFQPRVDLRAGKVVGAEALVRWQHPERGLLPPSAFLPQIEDHPLSITLGEWVIGEALRCLRAWQAEGLRLRVSLNIAARHLQSANLVGFIEQALLAYPEVSAQSLELEILETAAIEDLQHVGSVIEACQRLGIGAAIDDFGTGYSSLSYFKRLPAEVIKIDQSFIRDMLHDPEDLAIVEGVIGLSRVFRRTVVAEGVETEQHGLILLALGCDQAQGYAIARPMPAHELVAWARDYRPFPSWGEQVPHLAREDFALLGAEVEHYQWMDRIRAVLVQPDGAAHFPYLEVTECRLGRWLAHEGTTQRAGVASIRVLHDQLHVQADTIAAHLNAGERDFAQREFKLMQATRDQLFGRVRALIGIV